MLLLFDNQVTGAMGVDRRSGERMVNGLSSALSRVIRATVELESVDRFVLAPSHLDDLIAQLNAPRVGRGLAEAERSQLRVFAEDADFARQELDALLQGKPMGSTIPEARAGVVQLARDIRSTIASPPAHH